MKLKEVSKEKVHVKLHTLDGYHKINFCLFFSADRQNDTLVTTQKHEFLLVFEDPIHNDKASFIIFDRNTHTVLVALLLRSVKINDQKTCSFSHPTTLLM